MSSSTVPAFCHSCNETFLLPAARSDPESLRCRHCGSDFVELVEEGAVNPRALPRQHNWRHLFSEHMRSGGPRRPEEALFVLSEPRGSLRLLPVGSEDVVNDLSSIFDTPPLYMHNVGIGQERHGNAFGSDLGRLLQHMAQQHQPASTPASNDAMRRLRREKLKSGASGSCGLVNEHCAVCHEQYKEGDNVVHLPCEHVFHEGCVTPWFSEHNTCPVCRFALPVESSSSASRGAPPARHLRRPRRNQVAQELTHHHRDVTTGEPVIDTSFLDMFRTATDGDHQLQQFQHSRSRPSPQQQQFDHGPLEVTGENGDHFLSESIRSAQIQLRNLEEYLTGHLSERRRLQETFAQLHDHRQNIRDQLIAAQNQNLEAASAIASIAQHQQHQHHQQQQRRRRSRPRRRRSTSNDPSHLPTSGWAAINFSNGGGGHASHSRNSHDLGNSSNFSDSSSGNY